MTKKKYSVVGMDGDGIGPEVVHEALRVLDAAAEKFHFRLDYRHVPAGDASLRQFGDALPEKSVEAFASSDACLKGPVGESVRTINDKLRFGFDLYANLRPARSYPGICPPALRPNIDMTVIRENSEGFYRGLESRLTPDLATTTGVFSPRGAQRIAEFTLDTPRARLDAQGLNPVWSSRRRPTFSHRRMVCTLALLRSSLTVTLRLAFTTITRTRCAPTWSGTQKSLT